MMYKQFGSVELALAAYNAGPGNVAKYKGMPPFKETKIFVNQIMAEYKNQKNNPDPAIKKYKEVNKSENTLKNQVAEVQKTELKEVSLENEKPSTETNINENVQKDTPSTNLKDLVSMKHILTTGNVE